jgi:DNA-3-methyladenine glycosylase II
MFEALVNAFACQQLALEVRLELLNRLGTLCSARVGTLQDARYAFPSAHEVARLPPEEYRAIGFSHQKVRALLGLARAIVQRELDLESIAGENDSEVRQRLLELRGVGWGTPPLDYAGVRRAVEGWQPYAGLVYFHLLLGGLSQAEPWVAIRNRRRKGPSWNPADDPDETP